MTFRKDLRDAELAVIQRASDLVAVPLYRFDKHDPVLDRVSINGKRFDLLDEAVATLTKLRHQLNGDASPHSHTDTSANAARQMVPLAGSLRRSILVELYRRRHFPLPGATDDKLERALGRPHTSVSAARKFLYDTGWVVDSGARAETRAGREAIVWVLAPGSTEWLVEAIARNEP